MDPITPIINFIEKNFKKPILTLSLLYLIYKLLDKILEFNITIPYENHILAVATTFITFEIIVLIIKIAQGFFYYNTQKKILSTTNKHIKSHMRLYLRSNSTQKDILKKIISCDSVECSRIFPVNNNEKNQLKHALYNNNAYYTISNDLNTNPSLIKCIKEYVSPSSLSIYNIRKMEQPYWSFDNDFIWIDSLLLEVLEEDIKLPK